MCKKNTRFYNQAKRIIQGNKCFNTALQLGCSSCRSNNPVIALMAQTCTSTTKKNLADRSPPKIILFNGTLVCILYPFIKIN